LDVKEIKPVDEEIERLLDQSIKTSMTIMCAKLNDSAETASEKDRIVSMAEVEQLKRELINIENANYVKEQIETARIEGGALIAKARAEKDADELLIKARHEVELDNMRRTIELLNGPGGDAYLEFVKVQALHKNVDHVTMVPSDTKSLFIPQGNTTITEY
jgi:hypothetical protein